MSQRRRVMLVEDEPDVREITKLALETTTDYEIITCQDGREALEQLRQTPVELILLDVMMPRLDGLSLLERLREEERLDRSKVVFLTARARRENVEELLELGAVEVIEKPFDPIALGDRLDAVWEDHFG